MDSQDSSMRVSRSAGALARRRLHSQYALPLSVERHGCVKNRVWMKQDREQTPGTPLKEEDFDQVFIFC